MNVVIITTREPVYHQYLCAEIARRHHVVAVLHPQKPVHTRAESRALRRKNIEKFGHLHHLLQKLGKNRFRSFGWNERADLERAQRKYMPAAEAEYQSLVAPKAETIADINSREGIARLASFQPDVVLCSGGPIYRRALIQSTKLMLNFHTGLSPIYNGSYTIYWTYANRQPHLTGGTLMRMSPVVDGGDILAHYRPAIAADDTPADQFMKCIMGGARLYNRFLDDLAAGKSFVSVPQGPPFLYYYGHDWTVFQNLTIERSIKNQICKAHVRDEIVNDYWTLPDPAAARAALREVLLSMVQHA